jgi:hypothetical protein
MLTQPNILHNTRNPHHYRQNTAQNFEHKEGKAKQKSISNAINCNKNERKKERERKKGRKRSRQ